MGTHLQLRVFSTEYITKTLNILFSKQNALIPVLTKLVKYQMPHHTAYIINVAGNWKK